MSQFPIDPLLNAPGTTSARQTQESFGEMTSEDFLQIIFTELQNQDPFEPNDSSALLEQLNSIRSIEADLEMQRQLESIVTENQLASASGMIGKFVGGLTAAFDRVAGYVVSVQREGTDIQLELDNGWIIPFENVESVLDPGLLGDVPAPPPAGDGGTDPSGDDPVGDGADPGADPGAVDVDALLAAWGDGGAYDINGDGTVDISDLLDALGQQGGG